MYTTKLNSKGINIIKPYALINQKCVEDKSTTALFIGAGLKIKGFSVLYIDLDAKGN